MSKNTGWGLFPLSRFNSLVDEIFGEFGNIDKVFGLSGDPVGFDSLFTKTNYPYNVYVTSEKDVTYDVLEVALAGIDKERISVKTYDVSPTPYLEVSVKKPDKEEKEDKKYSVKRTTEKSFYLTLALPNHDLTELSANLKNGMLTVSVPRVGPKPKEVVVKEVKL